MIVMSQYLDDLILTTLAQHLGSGGFSGPLYNTNLILFQAPLILTNGTLFVNLTEATFSGYARKSGVVFSAPILQGDGTYTMVSNLYTFIASAMSTFVGNVIYGWALIDNSSPPNLLMAEMFASPPAIQVPNAGFGMTISFNVGPGNPNSFGTVVA